MKKLFFLILSCWVAGSLVAGPAEDAQRYYEDALVKFKEKEYKAVVIQLKNALQLVPGNLPARILMGRVLLELNDGVSAEKEIRVAQRMGADPGLILLPLAKALNLQRKYAEVIEQVPDIGIPRNLQADIRFQRGNAYLGLGRLAEATEAFETALRDQQDAVLPVVGLSMVALKQERFDQADALADRALEIDADNADAWNAKGVVAYGRGDLEKAIDYYRRALALSPTHYKARISLATCYLDAQRYPEAVIELRTLNEQSILDPQVSYLLSVALKNSNDFEGAREAMSQAAAIIDGIGFEALKRDPPKLLLAGLINYENREFESAFEYLSGFLKLDSENLVALDLLGSTQIGMGRPLDGVQTFKRALELDPENTGLLTKLGDAYLSTGNYIQAVETYQQAERLAPGQPDLLHKLGISLLAGKRHQEAVKELELALQKNPEATLTAMVLGAVHLSQGNLERARELAEQTVNREPGNPNALNLLATVYLGMGKPEVAREWYEKALAADPGFRPARINLAKLDLQDNRVDEARQALELLLANEPENATVMVELGKLEARQGDLDKAIRILRKASELDRRTLTPALQLIEIYVQKGDPALAVKVAEDLRAEHPDNLTVLETLGRAHLAAGNNDDAQFYFRRVVSLIGYDSEKLYEVAQWQLRAGSADDARWSLTKATEGTPDFLPAKLALIELQIKTGRLESAGELIDGLQPDHKALPAVAMLAGDLAMRRGEYESAVGRYRAALEKNDNAMLAIRLFQARIAMGDPVGAEQELVTWAEAHPDDLATKRLLAELHQRAGRLARAKQLYEEIYQTQPDDPSLLNNLALVYAGLGDIRSQEFARRAFELAPTNPSVIDTLGWLLVKEGHAERGLGYLRDAISRNSGSPEIRYHLAVALQDLGRLTEAREALITALRLADQFPGSDDARKRLTQLMGSRD
ncbi:MAG: PEP-CTERM system TPR-repeat protein PrsT [Gammaproteobacteria bacterium]|nr:PEP-CTERM system TPR-repeat protein PrsT [Gammaproteobacteria bacterium]